MDRGGLHHLNARWLPHPFLVSEGDPLGSVVVFTKFVDGRRRCAILKMSHFDCSIQCDVLNKILVMNKIPLVYIIMTVGSEFLRTHS